jgi:hypothetical protein
VESLMLDTAYYGFCQEIDHPVSAGIDPALDHIDFSAAKESDESRFF